MTKVLGFTKYGLGFRTTTGQTIINYNSTKEYDNALYDKACSFLEKCEAQGMDGDALKHEVVKFLEGVLAEDGVDYSITKEPADSLDS